MNFNNLQVPEKITIKSQKHKIISNRPMQYIRQNNDIKVVTLGNKFVVKIVK